MERAELERLDRDTLIERAQAAGVTRARILTRPELIDELLMRSEAGERDEGPCSPWLVEIGPFRPGLTGSR